MGIKNWSYNINHHEGTIKLSQRPVRYEEPMSDVPSIIQIWLKTTIISNVPNNNIKKSKVNIMKIPKVELINYQNGYFYNQKRVFAKTDDNILNQIQNNVKLLSINEITMNGNLLFNKTKFGNVFDLSLNLNDESNLSILILPDIFNLSKIQKINLSLTVQNMDEINSILHLGMFI